MWETGDCYVMTMHRLTFIFLAMIYRQIVWYWYVIANRRSGKCEGGEAICQIFGLPLEKTKYQ